MAWYKSPVKPYDPIIEDQKDNQAIRYLRDNFDTTGQDSNENPPSQDQALWESLSNIQPITQGTLSRRWGYQLLTDFVGPNPITRMYSFQNNNTLQRQLVYSSENNVYASSEFGDVNGTVNSVYSPVGSMAPRMVDSRNYGYFYDGTQADLIKWDGLGNTSNWGIAPANESLLSITSGPKFGTSATNQPASPRHPGTAWVNPINALTSDTTYATATHVGTSTNYTQFLSITNLGFTIPASATILGIQVDVQGFYSGPADAATKANGITYPTYQVYLTKTGTAKYGAVRYVATPKAIESYVTTGGINDLWGSTFVSTSWTPADINSGNFGAFVSGLLDTTTGQDVTFSVDAVRVSVTFTNSTSEIVVAPVAGGNINLTVGRVYYCVFANSITGHFGDLNDASESTGTTTNAKINLSNIPVSPDTQVDTKIILATADGGDPAILYFVASIANSITTYTDNTTEDTLLLNQQYLYTDPFGNEFGVTFNDPPPNGSLCIKHKGRLWMAQEQNLFFSKATAELTLPDGFVAGKYEESWPPQNYFDISGGAETISGLFSDGNVIYIGTQSHIRRIFGDSPSNFQEPEICHQDAGVLNQETWKDVFVEGTPLGFMWLTPDFKVMGSDGNTYVNVGHQIQDVLNSINPDAAQNCHAMFVQQGPYNLYVICIPTGTNTFCDTHCVFDLVAKQWFVWKPTDQSTSCLFNITASGAMQWQFATQVSNPGSAFFEMLLPPVFADVELHSNLLVYQYLPTALQDRVGNTAVDFNTLAKTSWLHLGAPTTRKVLDEMDIVGDPNMLVSIDGASTQSDFDSPISIISNAPLVLGPLETYKIFLASRTSKYRYYQLTFTSSNGSDPNFLDSFALRAIPWNTI